jgi:hypothetical protein
MGEERHTTEICEVLEKDEGVELNKLFEFSFESRKLVKKNESIKLSEKIMNSFEIDGTTMKKELEKRRKWLEKKSGMQLTMREFFGEDNDWRDEK